MNQKQQGGKSAFFGSPFKKEKGSNKRIIDKSFRKHCFFEFK